MALNITENLRQAIKNPQLTPVLVAKIDGYDTIFGNVSIKKYIRVGDPDLVIGNDWLIGGFNLVENQNPWISFSQGTTTRISQKLDPSRGQGSSVSQMQLAILDYNYAMTELVSPGRVLADVIGRRVTIFLGAQESSWPEDYNVVFRGVIQDVEAATDTVFLNLANTEEKKRNAIMPRIQTELAAAVDFRSATFQDLQFRNREDVFSTLTVQYIAGGTAGFEGVSIGGGGTTIIVQIQDGASTASQIKKAIENDPAANQLVEIKITGNNSDPQFIGSVVLSSDTTVDLIDASEFYEPSDMMETYVVIGDELLKYTGITGNQLTGVTRAENGSFAEFHEIGENVEQVLRFTDTGINIALKLMLSGAPEFYASDIGINSFQFFSPTLYIDNAIFFQGVDLQVDHGVTAGDTITITGATNGANNVTDAVIQEVGPMDDGSYIILADPLVDEPTTTAVAKFKSQFNVLPLGFGMIPTEVDVDQHIFVRNTFLPTFTLSIFAREITDGKGFLEKQVYMPMTCYSVPRKGRSSIVYTVGPLPTSQIETLDVTTVENPQQLKVKRSSNENFFNQVQFDYNYDPVQEKFLTRKNYPIEPDQSDRPVGIKPFKVQAQGLRTEDDAELISERAANRWLARYSNGAAFIKGIRAAFSIGYQIEIGDIVAVDFASLKLADFETGTRTGPLKLMEVMNKTLDNKTGEVSLDVVNTTFGLSDRYGLISPSSKVGVGSTTTKIILQKSWSTQPFNLESRKWNGYLNQEIIVHDEEWTTVYTTVIRGFDNNDPQGMSIDPIPAPPGENWIVQCPPYPSVNNQELLSFWKLRHAFFSPRVQVVAGVSVTRFTVAALDVGRFFIGSIVRVHNFDFTVDSPERTVTEIIGNDIIINESLGFIASSNEVVDLIGFPDEQQSYRVV